MIDYTKLPHKAPEFDLQELLEAGAHFGHQSHRWHPKMAEWIYTQKEGVHIFDLVKTAKQLQYAYNYAYELGKTGKTLVIVGSKRQAREAVKEAADRAGLFYITSRWLGGLLTNWEQVQKSLIRMMTIRKGLETGKYAGYTKFERLKLDEESKRLERFFGGLKDLKSKPDALFIIDPGKEKVAVKEALQVGVPMFGISDSNTDPRPLDIVIPANDDAVKSLKIIVNAIADAYLAGKSAQ